MGLNVSILFLGGNSLGDIGRAFMLTGLYKIMDKQQAKIDRAVKAKHKHWNKTEQSIRFCWAINNSTNSLSAAEKELGWNGRLDLIKSRYPEFMKMHEDEMKSMYAKAAEQDEQVDSLKREELKDKPF